MELVDREEVLAEWKIFKRALVKEKREMMEKDQLSKSPSLQEVKRKMECSGAYVTVYRKTGHNAACVNIEKRSIDFFKMYCFKPTEGNG